MQDVRKLAIMSKGINVDEVHRLQKLIPAHKLCEPLNDAVLSKETGAGTDESWDFFSEDTVNSNIVPVRQAEAEAESATSDEEPKPVPQSRVSRNKDRINYRELAGIRNAKRGSAAKRGFALRASRAKLDNIPTVPSGVHEALPPGKLDSMGLPDRYKARWVAKDFKQIKGLDYYETFSSVAKWWILLALILTLFALMRTTNQP